MLAETGEFGFTTGPWVYEQDGTGKKTYGHYVSVWRKQADGTWRVILDVGIAHQEPKPHTGDVETRGERREFKPVDQVESRRALMKADREFSRASATQGFAKAFAAHASSDARLYRTGSLPARTEPTEEEGIRTWEPEAAEVSSAGDLGYTYGTQEVQLPDQAKKPFPYVRIWRRKPGDDWKTVIDLHLEEED